MSWRRRRQSPRRKAKGASEPWVLVADAPGGPPVWVGVQTSVDSHMGTSCGLQQPYIESHVDFVSRAWSGVPTTMPQHQSCHDVAAPGRARSHGAPRLHVTLRSHDVTPAHPSSASDVRMPTGWMRRAVIAAATLRRSWTQYGGTAPPAFGGSKDDGGSHMTWNT